MAYINNSLVNRFAAPQKAAGPDPVHLLSNRQAKPTEQTTYFQSTGADSTSPSLTYTNPTHRAAISSQGLAKAPTRSDPLDSHFEHMGAVKALVERYKGAVEGGARSHLPKSGTLFDLTLTTKDGDTVTLQVSANTASNQKGDEGARAGAANFSFAVAGDLNDDERKTIDALVNRLGDIARNYHQDGWADVEFLDALDRDLIVGLDLKIAGGDQGALTVAYHLNADSGTHSLTVNQNQYKYEIDAQAILASTKLAAENHDIYLQYRQVLIDATQSYKAGEFSGGVKNTDALEFFLGGLDAMIAPSIQETNNSSNINVENTKGLARDSRIYSDHANATSAAGARKEDTNPRKSTTEQAFLSGLPDFFASFNTPLFTPNASNRGEVSQMSLSMEQVTEASVKPGSGVKSVEQRYSYESRVSQHLEIGSHSAEHANLSDASKPGGQTYLYEVVEQAQSLTRTLDMDIHGKALAYLEEQDSEHEKRSKTVVNGFIADNTKEDLTDPKENYAYALQAMSAVTKASLRPAQIRHYVDIQTLEEMIKASRINFYS